MLRRAAKLAVSVTSDVLILPPINPKPLDLGVGPIGSDDENDSGFEVDELRDSSFEDQDAPSYSSLASLTSRLGDGRPTTASSEISSRSRSSSSSSTTSIQRQRRRRFSSAARHQSLIRGAVTLTLSKPRTLSSLRVDLVSWEWWQCRCAMRYMYIGAHLVRNSIPLIVFLLSTGRISERSHRRMYPLLRHSASKLSDRCRPWADVARRNPYVSGEDLRSSGTGRGTLTHWNDASRLRPIVFHSLSPFRVPSRLRIPALSKSDGFVCSGSVSLDHLIADQWPVEHGSQRQDLLQAHRRCTRTAQDGSEWTGRNPNDDR